jgi:hypothetical protein
MKTPAPQLDSRAVACVKQDTPTTWSLYIRAHYQENLGIWSFTKWLKSFKSEHEASLFFKKNWPQGKLVSFDKLTQD